MQTMCERARGWRREHGIYNVSTEVTGVDEPILEEAQRVLGTQTPRDTVNAALREVVRKKLVEEFFSMMSERDPEELENLRREAWR
jgi:Arc/MetJ family transcription regulator